MAILIPSWKQILSIPPKPTEGEKFALEQLEQALDDTYEIFFQPTLNGYRADIIVLKKNFGVFIFEIKDWNLENYEITPFNYWILKKNNARILSPFEQIKKYKKRLYDLTIQHLLTKNIMNKNCFGIVKLSVLFSCTTQRELHQKFKEAEMKYSKNFDQILKYTNPLGYDRFNEFDLKELFRRNYFFRNNSLFDDTLYLSFMRYLKPSLDLNDAYKPIILSKKQQVILNSNREKQKITGFAGSGKTTVLAKKVVHYLTSHPPISRDPDILILHYNATIKNMIEQKIKIFLREVSNDTSISELLKRIEIQTYHSFFAKFIEFQFNYETWPNELKNILSEKSNGLMPEHFDDWPYFDDWPHVLKNCFFEYYYNNTINLKNVQSYNTDYLAILVDEIQDFKKIWIKNILTNLNYKYYLVFGDEHQNLYHQKMDEGNRPYTGISGNWVELKDTFRLPSRFATIAYNFQEKFLQGKYQNFIPQSQRHLFSNEHFTYTNLNLSKLNDYLNTYLKQHSVNPNDITILSSTTSILKEIDYFLTIEQHLSTITTFESLFGERFLICKHSFIDTTPKKIALQNIYVDTIRKHLHTNQDLVTELVRNSLDDVCLNDAFKQLKLILDQENTINGIHFKNDIEKIRKSKKFHFHPFSGKIKLSTISSFKGWESNTILIILDHFLPGEINYELYFTAITRCKENLIIINNSLNENELTLFFSAFQKENRN